MTTANPNERNDIPDERTEEEELQEQIEHAKARELWGDVIALKARLYQVRKENAAFLREYAPDAIGSDPEDTFTDDTCSRTMNKEKQSIGHYGDCSNPKCRGKCNPNKETP